jgi:hypothetical protein
MPTRASSISRSRTACSLPCQAEDAFGQPADFARSASLRGARELNLTGQGIYDGILFTTHLGILNSPDTWAATLRFLSER